MKEKIKIYICDDNIEFADSVEKEIKLCLADKQKYEAKIFDNGISLLNEFDIQVPDVVFLDIDMPEMDGFEVASQIQKRKEETIIIFVTSHDDMVYNSYKYHPFWFIRKSHMHDFETMVTNLLNRLDTESKRKKSLFNLKIENRVIEIDINTVTYIESYKNDIIIHDRINEKRQVRCKISEAEKQLYNSKIIRIQNGYLVNCRFISKVTSRDVILTDGTHLSLSRSRIDFVINEYQNFIKRTII